MKKMICLVLSVVLLGTVTVAPIQAETTVSTERSPFFFFKHKLPVIDDHFLNYISAGVRDSRPTLMVGDSNIGGKIDANDALFALIYGLTGTFEERDENGNNPMLYTNKNNPYEGSLYTTNPGTHLKSKLEGYFIDYYSGEKPQREKTLKNFHYIYNSALMADVSNDGECNAVDAMYILQYAVGMIDTFPRSDFEEQGNMFYFPWIDEWRPRMLHKYSDFSYRDIVLPPEPVA